MNSVEGNTLILLLTFGAWGVGGWLLTRVAFRSYRHESMLIGIAFGVIAATWLANLLAPLIAVPYAFWLTTLILLLGAAAVSQPWRNLPALTE
ncbi:MAG TPA: hypothetical protein VHO49_15660, partial [Anaerolineales bacterium]|nr:hypothetical protein [Anaerolineales bacterium]